MEYTIEFEGDPQDVTVTTTGVADVSGFLAYLEALVSDARFRPGMSMLFDHSALDLSALSGDDPETIGRFLESIDERLGNGPSASVTPAPYAFGLVRQGHLVAAANQRRMRRVFQTREGAMSWLAEEI